MKKKKWVVVLVIIVIAILSGATVLFLKTRKDKKHVDGIVYVESVGDMMGSGMSVSERYMGVVESQETKDIQKDDTKTIKAIYVEAGDLVKEGDKLFEYDMDEMELKLKQLELELTSINNSITITNSQITTLEAEKKSAPEENKIEYTSQIQSLQAQVNQLNYDASSKQLEIERQKAAMENSIVYSPMDGTIKEVNNSDGGDENYGYEDYYGGYGDGSSGNAFISIIAMGDYRIKGTVNELNVYSLYEGQAVIVRSRLDSSIIWNGTISLIDTEHTQSDNNYYYYGGESVSKYSFYVDLESTENLMMGQHVYIEPDYGYSQSKEGMWLYDYYIFNEGNDFYVWAEDEDGYIEKRLISVGEYDEEMFSYEILSGLDNDDYIAFPEDRIKEGMKATHNYEDVMDQMGDDDYGDYYEEDYYEEDYYEEDYYEDLGDDFDGEFDDSYDNILSESDDGFNEDFIDEMIPKSDDDIGDDTSEDIVE
ncbi:MAG: efflux RND transporter periplasmic adaptor subunit [Wujia sp.]